MPSNPQPRKKGIAKTGEAQGSPRSGESCAHTAKHSNCPHCAKKYGLKLVSSNPTPTDSVSIKKEISALVKNIDSKLIGSDKGLQKASVILGLWVNGPNKKPRK